MATRHHDTERELQDRIEAAVGAALPAIEVLDVQLDEPRERVVVFIDTPGGIGLEHCEAVTHAIRDTCPDHELEVSSPGLERPMRHARHLRAHIGERVRLREHGKHRASTVDLVGVDDDAGITIRADDGAERVVSYADIIRCKLVAGAAPVGDGRRGRT